MNNKDHNQWNRELLTQAYDRLQSKCYQSFSKDIHELNDDELNQVKDYLKQDSQPAIMAIYGELLKELE